MCIPPSADREPAPANGINEAVLAAVWNEQYPLRGPMWDCEGKPVAVIYRGRWTAGSGPDFDGAILALGEASSRPVTGSVEVHLRCADWWAHGHHTDRRYDSVILHVVLWPTGARPVVRADGVTVPTLVLADYITLSSSALVERAQPLLSNLGALSERPCWERTEGRPLETLLGEIERAGDIRFEAKASVMEADIEAYGSAEEVFYRGLMDSLGYAANREPMRSLASALPLSVLAGLPRVGTGTERATVLEAALLGAGGFLPSERPDLGRLDWLSTQYAEEVEELWSANAPLLGLSAGEAVAPAWNFDRVRPANAPPRRLAGAARLLTKLLEQPGGMLRAFLEYAPGEPAASLAKRWAHQFTVPAEGYWAAHADFGRPLERDTERDTALVGGSRAADIVVNVLLPLLAAYAAMHDLPAPGEKAREIYAAHPRLAENRITRAMASEVLGPRARGAITSARRQQGLIHLYKEYCRPRRCYECPISGASTRFDRA